MFRTLSPMLRSGALLAGISCMGLLGVAAPLVAHCDTLDGPVVTAARRALVAADLEPLLRWVPAESEAELQAAFAQTLAVREQSAVARELADRWFFETLVRLHRQGEGFPFTGLRPAGSPVAPVIQAADRALETADAGPLAERLATAVAEGVRTRFREALEARVHADESVAAGRRFVAAYVELTHYAEAVDAVALAHAGAHAAEAAGQEVHPE